MQVVYKDEDEGSTTRGTGPMGAVLCTRRVSRCVEGKCVGRTGSKELEFETVGEFLAEIKKEFGGGEEELVKAAELRIMEQGRRTMEEFVQEFKRAARGSGYEEQSLVKEFKREMNRVIRRRLMEAENQLGSIEQWYKRATTLNRN